MSKFKDHLDRRAAEANANLDIKPDVSSLGSYKTRLTSSKQEVQNAPNPSLLKKIQDGLFNIVVDVKLTLGNLFDKRSVEEKNAEEDQFIRR